MVLTLGQMTGSPDWHAPEGLDFPQLVRSLQSQAEVVSAFAERIGCFGYDTYAIGSLPEPEAPGPGRFFLHNWPDIWAEQYFEQGYGPEDPTLIAAARCREPVTISEIRAGKAGFWPSPKGIEMLDFAASLGRSSGLVVPIFGPNGYRGIVAMGGNNNDPSEPRRALLHLWSIYAHNRALELQPQSESHINGHAALSPREISVLKGSAMGEDDEAISQTLGISIRTVRFHFENARRKLRCKTRSEAVATATSLHLL